jgi:hypothetical protein
MNEQEHSPLPVRGMRTAKNKSVLNHLKDNHFIRIQ